MNSNLDEESRQLLRRILESLASRQLAAINILGHCLKYVGELDVKVEVASELNLSLRLFREVRKLYAEFGWTDLESAVRDRVESMPYPESRLEFGAMYYVKGVAESVAMASYTACECKEFAAIAMSYLDAAQARPQSQRFIDYCADPTNRPQAQQFFDRWHRVAMQSLGRPGTAIDRRVVDLGLRSKTRGELVEQYEQELEPFLERCGLRFPEEAQTTR